MDSSARQLHAEHEESKISTNNSGSASDLYSDDEDDDILVDMPGKKKDAGMSLLDFLRDSAVEPPPEEERRLSNGGGKGKRVEVTSKNLIEEDSETTSVTSGMNQWDRPQVTLKRRDSIFNVGTPRGTPVAASSLGSQMSNMDIPGVRWTDIYCPTESDNAPGGNPCEDLALKRHSMYQDLVERMKTADGGLAVQDYKSFRKVTPDVFFASDLVSWIQNYSKFPTRELALNLAQQLYQNGYLFPISFVALGDEQIMCRFQTPLWWPTQPKVPTDQDYALFLIKKGLTKKTKTTLLPYEQENMRALKELLGKDWAKIEVKAAEQNKKQKSSAISKLSKDKRLSRDRKIYESQEQAFWYYHRPPFDMGQRNLADPRIHVRHHSPLYPNLAIPPMRKIGQEEADMALSECIRSLKMQMDSPIPKISQISTEVLEQMQENWKYVKDPLVRSKDWEHVSPDEEDDYRTDNQWCWQPDETRAKKLGTSFVVLTKAPVWKEHCDALLRSNIGIAQFHRFLSKEYSDENLNFYHDAWVVRAAGAELLNTHIRRVFDTYFSAATDHEINADDRDRKKIQKAMDSNEYSREMFDDAKKAIYNLMAKDSFPRFLRDGTFKQFLQSHDAL
eukprot:Clim_evm9s222 gene=Clim_evmTU9s222